MSLQDLKDFRQLDSKTPGHPESHLTQGIEVTTGPLGQGLANSVGLAMAEAHMASVFNKPDVALFDNYTYVILGDGCVQEGISSEASSLAGHLGLGKLIFLYDDNKVQIDGHTELAFSEDVDKRYEAYGFHVQAVADGDNDLESIAFAIEAARNVKDRPSFIRISTTIGYGSKAQGTEKTHGSALGPDDVAQVKRKFGFNPEKFFDISEDVYEFYKTRAINGEKQAAKWNDLYHNVFAAKYPGEFADLERRLQKKLPIDLDNLLPKYTKSSPDAACRKFSENVLNAINGQVTELMTGSADLAHSTLTMWKDCVDFQKPGKIGNYSGRNVNYGVREHAMFAIATGLSAFGGIIPITSTFLNFITYGFGAVRLAALSHLQSIYVLTHDSIGLGEDGPTHQPIETLALLRATPNMLVFRPADGNEVSGSYKLALGNISGPSVLALSRQSVPNLENTSIDKVQYGAYVIHESPQRPQAILVGTGTEVHLCVQAAMLLQDQQIYVRVVSMPCWELFNKQPIEYQRSIFIPQIPSLSVEAATTFGWSRYAHASIGMEQFGASGPYKKVFSKFGFTVENIVGKARILVQHYKDRPVPELLENPFNRQ